MNQATTTPTRPEKTLGGAIPRVLALFLAVCLSACGGGGGSGGAPAASAFQQAPKTDTPPADPPAAGNPVSAPPASVPSCSVDYWGDSISALTAPKLSRALAVSAHSVVGGTAQAAQAQFLQAPLDTRFVIVEYGTNEANSQQPLEPALRSMLDRIKALGRTPVLTGLSRATAGDALYHSAYALLIGQLAQQYGAVYADWPSVPYSGAADLMADGVHPNDAYQQRLADALSAAILAAAPECRQ